MENSPVFPTSLVAISAKLSMNFEHTDFFSWHEVASASAIAPFVIGLPAAFVAAFMGAIACEILCARGPEVCVCVFVPD